MSRFLTIILIGCGVVIAVLTWKVNHPHAAVAPAIHSGRIDSSLTISKPPPTIRRGDSVAIRDSLRVRDTLIWRFKDSLNVSLPACLPAGQARADGSQAGESTLVNSTVKDTTFHFYGIGGRDKRGDSACLEMGSSTFGARKPSDLVYNFAIFPAPDTTTKYHQVDTVLRTIHSGWGWSISAGVNYGYRPDVGKADPQVGIGIGYGYQFSK
jgi:hypothetical protein